MLRCPKCSEEMCNPQEPMTHIFYCHHCQKAWKQEELGNFIVVYDEQDNLHRVMYEHLKTTIRKAKEEFCNDANMDLNNPSQCIDCDWRLVCKELKC